MNDDKLYHEGQLYLTLETVAKIYQLQVVWLREVFDRGLLGRGVDSGTTVCIAAAQIDRVATIVRLHGLGLDVEAICLELDDVV